MRERVEQARAIQRERFKDVSLQTNSDSAKPPRGMGPAEIRQFCPLDTTGTHLIKAANEVADAVEHAGVSPDAERKVG